MLDDVIRYTDSHFARSKPDQKLTWGHGFVLAGATIRPLSKIQSIVAIFVFDVEYFAICEVGEEAV